MVLEVITKGKWLENFKISQISCLIMNLKILRNRKFLPKTSAGQTLTLNLDLKIYFYQKH